MQTNGTAQMRNATGHSGSSRVSNNPSPKSEIGLQTESCEVSGRTRVPASKAGPEAAAPAIAAAVRQTAGRVHRSAVSAEQINRTKDGNAATRASRGAWGRKAYHAGPIGAACYTIAGQPKLRQRMPLPGRIRHLFLKPGHGQPMLPVEACQAVEGMGLAQDAAFGRSKRQVLLIESETLQAFGIQPGDVRENVTVEGLALSQLTPSTRLSAGQVVLEVVGLCAPCNRMDEVRQGLQVELQEARALPASSFS